MGLFGGKSSGGESGSGAARFPRHSSGWVHLIKHMQSEESLRVLDFGPTSAGNINFVTAMGHSIYMANLIDDAQSADYRLPSVDSQPAEFDVDKFLAENLDFQGRIFDVVLLWDTLDYLPKELIQPVADRLYEVMSPGGQLLAFFHAGAAPGAIAQGKATEETALCRYHLTNTDVLELQRVDGRNVLQTQTNRQAEATFHRYSNFKSFLAKDNLREVVVTR